MAQVIWCCITLCQPEIPPVPEHVEIQLPAGSPGPTKFLTYGAYILDPRFAAVDEDIRHTVLWCLAHHPEDRPDLATLRRLVDAKGRSRGDAAAPTAAGPDAGLTDAELKRWFGLVLLEPGPKPLPKYDPNGPDDQVSRKDQGPFPFLCVMIVCSPLDRSTRISIEVREDECCFMVLCFGDYVDCVRIRILCYSIRSMEVLSDG